MVVDRRYTSDGNDGAQEEEKGHATGAERGSPSRPLTFVTSFYLFSSAAKLPPLASYPCDQPDSAHVAPRPWLRFNADAKASRGSGHWPIATKAETNAHLMRYVHAHAPSRAVGSRRPDDDGNDGPVSGGWGDEEVREVAEVFVHGGVACGDLPGQSRLVDTHFPPSDRFRPESDVSTIGISSQLPYPCRFHWAFGKVSSESFDQGRARHTRSVGGDLPWRLCE